MHSQFKMNALSILSLAAVWEIAGRMADSTLIPPLTQIAAAWYKLLLGGKLLPNLGASLWTMVVGFVLAVLVGIVIGLLMGRFRAVEHFLDLYVNALMSAPTTAFVPVLILWFGLGVQSRIAVVFLFAVFVVIGSLTVAGPVVFFLVAPRRAAGPLSSIKDFMAAHNAVIMMVVLLVLGAKLIGNGIAGLTD